jgi:sulfate transport system permease protein
MSSASGTLAPSRAGVAVRVGFAAYVLALVGLPLAALVAQGLRGGLSGVWRVVSAPVAAHALWLTFWTAALMAVVNAVMGTAAAWVLVRYRFPGRAALSALIDLPFAVPTLVAGVLLTVLLGPQSDLGGWLGRHGVRVIFAPPSIVLVLLFVTLPFVVRAVEPVLLELDPAEEEAAWLLGAGPVTTFTRVVLPALAPAILSGTIRSFARALAEFGSVVVVAGNIPHRTLTAPVFIFGEVESGRPGDAAAASVVLLVASVLLLVAARQAERLTGRDRG